MTELNTFGMICLNKILEELAPITCADITNSFFLKPKTCKRTILAMESHPKAPIEMNKK